MGTSVSRTTFVEKWNENYWNKGYSYIFSASLVQDRLREVVSPLEMFLRIDKISGKSKENFSGLSPFEVKFKSFGVQRFCKGTSKLTFSC